MLTREELEDIQAELMADDLDVDMDKMCHWSESQARTYFESGGEVEPPAPYTAPHTAGVGPTGVTPWLSCHETKAAATWRLVLFSWTGNRGGQGSAHNARRAPLSWSKELPEAEVYEVLLPGRGMRHKEELCTNTPRLVEEMTAALGGALAGGKPYAFVGFAFGAVLAWEVAQAIASVHENEGPALLCAVSSEGPGWPKRLGKLHAASDAAFKAALASKGGTEFILRDEGALTAPLPGRHPASTLESGIAAEAHSRT
jgi:hypothetical protein